MMLSLTSLRRGAPGEVLAEFNSAGGIVAASFAVDSGVDLATAHPTPNVFVGFEGTAEDVRRIVAAVVAFSRASAETGQERLEMP